MSKWGSGRSGKATCINNRAQELEHTINSPAPSPLPHTQIRMDGLDNLRMLNSYVKMIVGEFENINSKVPAEHSKYIPCKAKIEF